MTKSWDELEVSLKEVLLSIARMIERSEGVASNQKLELLKLALEFSRFGL
jgi:hypothetical protein